MEPKLFISYSSLDSDRVRAIVAALDQRGFRCWRDKEGISYGDDWLKRIDDAIEESGAFLAFISRSFSQRDVAIHEVRQALKRQAKEKRPEDYPIVFLFLEPVGKTAFGEDIRDAMRRMQCIRYWKEFRHSGFLTPDFVRRLTGANWPESIIDQDKRKMMGMERWKPGNWNQEMETALIFEAQKLPERSVHRLSREAVLNKRVPEEDMESVSFQKISLEDGKTLVFYRLSPDDIESTTVYPTVMDDQWVPPEFYDPTPNAPNSSTPQYDGNSPLTKEFQSQGLTSNVVKREIVSRQRREIIRCLLHNWQVVVNRAFIVNSEVFRQWYAPGDNNSEDYSAFRSLIGDDSIVVFLSREDHPLFFPSYATTTENVEKWRAFCLDVSKEEDTSVACLRLDWNNNSNEYENKSLLDYQFQEFCLTTAENEYRMKAMMNALGMAPEMYLAFRECWRAVQKDVIEWTRNYDRPYNRSRFYESFITPFGEQVNDGKVDPKKKFSAQFKQIVDFRYNLNLTTALQIQPAFPPQFRLNAFLIAGNSDLQRQRELSKWELMVAVEDFSENVLRNSKSFLSATVRMPKQASFELRHLPEIRKSKEWDNYVRKLSESKTRSRLSEPDFFSIGPVWEEYCKFLEWMSANPLFSDWDWDDIPGALSVIYHFEEIRLVAIYKRCLLPRVFCPEDEETVALSKKSGSLSRKTGLYIDYICGDVSDDPHWENALLTEIRLFEGITYESGKEVFDALLKCLNETGKRRASE